MALNPRQQRFVAEYLVDLNATQAAIRAGYSSRTAAAIGHENLRKPEIAAAVASARNELTERTEVTIESVVAELAKLGFARLGEPPSAAVKHDALVSLGKHLGMFTNRHVIEGSIEHRVALMSPAERVARADQLLESAAKYLPLLEQHENERAEEPESEPNDTRRSGRRA
jgi:phage terminase small subunit